MSGYDLELWADSFHEGQWALDALAQIWPNHKSQRLAGFLPRYAYALDTARIVSITAYGGFKNWSPLPAAIKELLEWGKSDLVLYDPRSRKVLMTAEETAATPTGNQAMQRGERTYGSARAQVPHSYLLGQFGRHTDGGARQNAIWPFVQAIKLSTSHQTISTVLHYGTKNTPDAYATGLGVANLFQLLSLVIRRYTGENVDVALAELLCDEYERMLAFVDVNWPKLVRFFPGADLCAEGKRRSTALMISKRALGGALDPSLKGLSVWPLTADAPKHRTPLPGLAFRREDAFLRQVNGLLLNDAAYLVMKGRGSRPQPKTDVMKSIAWQAKNFSLDTGETRRFTLSIDQFPPALANNVHVQTALGIVYLIDSAADLEQCYWAAFGRPIVLNHNGGRIGDTPVFLYVCNSILKGRFLGDPYTGQLATYVPAFSRNADGSRNRLTIAYYPHQSHYQFLRARRTKGVAILSELVDVAIFHAGVAIDTRTRQKL